MPKFNIRIDDELYEQLHRRARGAGLPLATFCRSILTEAADPHGRYVYSSQDEILATSIQILSILATSVGEEAPAVLEQGLNEARAILAERRLLAESVQP
jgi:hypothetical protein